MLRSVNFPNQGHDNYAFEMEAPKSPWRYPHLNFRDSKRNRRGRFGPNHRQPDTRVQVRHNKIHIGLPG